MYIASAPDFVQEISIPNRDSPAILESIKWYIAKYEPIFLELLLGADLATLLPGEEAKYVTLRGKVKPALLNYIYYQYVLGNLKNFTGTEFTVSKFENSIVVSAGDKLISVWNEMVDLNFRVCKFLMGNLDYLNGNLTDLVITYHPSISYARQSEIFGYINRFGL